MHQAHFTLGDIHITMSNFIYPKLSEEERTRIVQLQQAMMFAKYGSDIEYYNDEINKIIKKIED